MSKNLLRIIVCSICITILFSLAACSKVETTTVDKNDSKANETEVKVSEVKKESKSTDIKKILWVTEEWDGYTNKDGTGIYNEILNEVFTKNGIEVERVYYPWKRSLTMVKDGEADVTGGDEINPDYLPSENPVIQDQMFVIYKKSKINKWDGLTSLKGKKGSWYLGMLDTADQKIKDFLKNEVEGSESEDRINAFKMLMLDRTDFYYDNLDQMNQTIKELGNEIKIEEYDKKLTDVNNLYWQFTKNDRGEAIRKIYDENFLKLYKSGDLEKIYKKYNLLMPDITLK